MQHLVASEKISLHFISVEYYFPYSPFIFKVKYFPVLLFEVVSLLFLLNVSNTVNKFPLSFSGIYVCIDVSVGSSEKWCTKFLRST